MLGRFKHASKIWSTILWWDLFSLVPLQYIQEMPAVWAQWCVVWVDFFIDWMHIAQKHRLSFCPLFPSPSFCSGSMSTLFFLASSLLGGSKWTIHNYDGQGTHLTFKVPLCFLIGDVDGHDLLCGFYWSHHTKRLSSQECDCPTDKASNSKSDCTFTSMLDDITRMWASPNKKECLQYASYHDVDNAFSDVWLGASNLHGIHCVTPLEVLPHVIQKSWHDNSLNMFIGLLTDGPRWFLEALAKHMLEQLHHQSQCNLPCRKFSHGTFTISQLQAHMRQLLVCAYFSCYPCTAMLDGTNITAVSINPLWAAAMSMR
jgi:hypothetical protein